MDPFFIDFIITSVLIISITALLGVLVSACFKFFTKKQNKSEYINQMRAIQNNWKPTGGKKLGGH